MGIKLPKLTQEEVESLAKDLVFTLTYHKEIDEETLDTSEKSEYEKWKVEYEKEMKDENE